MTTPLDRPVLNNQAPISAVRQFLRDSTHGEHVRLNQHPMLAGITRPDYSLDRYQLVLVAYYHFYKIIEGAISQFLATRMLPFSYDRRRKLQWIEDDLMQFGIDPEAPAFLPRSPSTAVELRDIGQLVGVLYTIEGSSLGGQVISRHLEAHLGLTATQGARFFHGYGPDIASYWQQTEAFIDATLTHDEIRDSAMSSAKTTFSLMESLLDDYHLAHQPV